MSPAVALHGRLRKLEAVTAEAQIRRCREAWARLATTMVPEHVDIVSAWWAAVADCWNAVPRAPLWQRILRFEVPALPRAAVALVAYHLEVGAPLDLRDEIAEVYLTDSDAWPLDHCEGCGYGWPLQCRLPRYGLIEVIGRYTRTCHLCGGSTGDYEECRTYRFPEAR